MLKNVHPLALLALILVAILLLFVACDDDEVVYSPSPVPVSQVQPPVIQQPAPVVVGAPAASHDGFLTGLIAGHLMGGGGNGGSNVVHRTTIINNRPAKCSFFSASSRSRSYSRSSSFRRR